MPYKTESKRLPIRLADKRVKLLDCQRERMVVLRRQGFTWLQLTKMFHVSKRLCQFICNPALLQAQKALFAERQKDGRYYDREKHNKSVADLRKRKNDLFNDFNIE